VAACGTELLWAIRRDQPVADIVRRVCAIAVRAAPIRQGVPYLAIGLERCHGRTARQIPKRQLATLAARIFEIRRLRAILALETLEQPHDRQSVAEPAASAC
jgi:hypothetical protein